MFITIDDNDIEVVIETKNNKNLYMRFKEDNKLHVSANKFVTQKQIIKIINENKKSILNMYNKNLEKLNNEQFFNYLGEQYTIVFDEVKNVTFDNDLVITKDLKMLDKYYSNQCIKIFNERINKCLLMFDNIPEFKLKIRKMTTRWGVNNSTDNIITLNSELLKREISLIDYVIIHELCHFYQHNHSKLFWLEVEKRYPYYKLARKKLREV